MDFNDVVKIIEKYTAPMRRRISLVVGRAVLSAAADDSKTFQIVQVDALADETLSDIERIQEYGFTSVPFEGAEAIMVFPQGNRDHGIAIAVGDRRFRLKGLEDGEVALYTDEGDTIEMKRGGIIHVNSSMIELGPDATEAVIKGDTFQTLFNEHKHVDSNGYNTTPPIEPLDGSELSTTTFTE